MHWPYFLDHPVNTLYVCMYVFAQPSQQQLSSCL